MITINEPQIGQGAGRHHEKDVTISVLLGAVLAALLLSVSCISGGAPTPSPTAGTIREQIVAFGTTVKALEKERDGVVSDYQLLATNLMDMGTADVFKSADRLVTQQEDLNSRLLSLQSSVQEIAAVHSIFAIAYRTELEAY